MRTCVGAATPRAVAPRCRRSSTTLAALTTADSPSDVYGCTCTASTQSGAT